MEKMSDPNAVTLSEAVTFCSRVLVPATSKRTVLLSLLYSMLTFSTLIVAVPFWQLEKPLVPRTSFARAVFDRAARAHAARTDHLEVSFIVISEPHQQVKMFGFGIIVYIVRSIGYSVADIYM